MSVNFSKRMGAYIIDFMIFIMVTSLITGFLPRSSKLIEVSKQMTDLQDSYMEKETQVDEYISKYKELAYTYDKENIASSICNIVFILGYFAIIPVINNGQTLGKKIMKIKVVKNNGKLTIIDMLIRNTINTSLIQVLLPTILVYLVSNNIYFNIISIVSFIQILLVIITIFMILYRKDKKGVQDLITRTQVIEV